MGYSGIQDSTDQNQVANKSSSIYDLWLYLHIANGLLVVWDYLNYMPHQWRNYIRAYTRGPGPGKICLGPGKNPRASLVPSPPKD